MKQLIVVVTLMSTFVVAMGQRPSFAGARPVGYKDRLQSTTANTNEIANRFGETVTTDKLPNLALGDRELVDRLNTLPVDQRPFWLINSEAIEAQKNQGIAPTDRNPNSDTIADRFGTDSSQSVISYPQVVYPIQMSATQQQQAQEMFNKQIASNQESTNSNSLPNQIQIQKPVLNQQTVNDGPKQIPVQGRLPVSSGYSG